MVRPNLKFYQLLKIKADCLKQEIQNKCSNNYVMLNLVNTYIHIHVCLHFNKKKALILRELYMIIILMLHVVV